MDDAPGGLERSLTDLCQAFATNAIQLAAGVGTKAVGPDRHTAGAEFIRNGQQFKQIVVQCGLAAEDRQFRRPVEILGLPHKIPCILERHVGRRGRQKAEPVAVRAGQIAAISDVPLRSIRLRHTVGFDPLPGFVTPTLAVPEPYVARDTAHLAQVKEVVCGMTLHGRIGQDAEAAGSPPGTGGLFVMTKPAADVKRAHAIKEPPVPQCRIVAVRPGGRRINDRVALELAHITRVGPEPHAAQFVVGQQQIRRRPEVERPNQFPVILHIKPQRRGERAHNVVQVPGQTGLGIAPLDLQTQSLGTLLEHRSTPGRIFGRLRFGRQQPCSSCPVADRFRCRLRSVCSQ